MSCQECDKIREQNIQGKNIAYLRVGNGNVAVAACNKHFNMLRQLMGSNVCEDAPVHRVIEEERPATSGLDLEKLANLEHEQWAHWTRYMLDNLTDDNIKRWRLQIDIPYSELSEKEKESDRKWARKAMRQRIFESEDNG